MGRGRRRPICDHGSVRDPRIVFVSSPYQNAFFGELAAAFVEALESIDVSSLITSEPGAHEVDDDDVFVLLPPHEYAAIEGTAFLDDPIVAARTIGISAEQPHQVFFRRNAEAAAKLGAVLDFSPFAVDAYRRLGIPAQHQPFGYVPSWDRFHGAARSVSTEVLYLGNKQPRRLAALAGAADSLVRHRAVLRISDNSEPNVSSSPSFVSGDAKRELLASTRLLVNVHQSDEPYFEWLRFADAAHCGVPVLSERSSASDPFVAGVHYLSFDSGDMGQALDAALSDHDRLDDVARAAYDVLRRTPLASSLDPLLTAAEALLDAPPPPRLPSRTRATPVGRDRTDPYPRHRWSPPRRRRLRRAAGGGTVMIAPEHTVMRGEFDLAPGELLATCIADGFDADGVPTLEGIWPWEPWRLLQGQHLGRVMVVDRSLRDAVHRWIAEPWVDDHEYLAVQLFAVVHGIEGAHRARPLASVAGSVLDPEQRVPPEIAERCRQLLSGSV